MDGITCSREPRQRSFAVDCCYLHDLVKGWQHARRQCQEGVAHAQEAIKWRLDPHLAGLDGDLAKHLAWHNQIPKVQYVVGHESQHNARAIGQEETAAILLVCGAHVVVVLGMGLSEKGAGRGSVCG